MTLPRSTSLALLALLLPQTALAVDAVVPPLVAKGVDPLVNLNLTSLVSSEADFLGVFENVNQLETAPATLNAACLASTACLYKIAKDNGADAVVAGQATPGGGNYEFKLVYYDAAKNRIVRTVSFTLPDSPAAIADGMGGYVKEAVTGSAPAQPEAAALGGFDEADLFAEDDYEAVAPSGDSNSRRIPTGGSAGRVLEDVEDEEEVDDSAAKRAAEQAAAKRAADEAAAKRAAEEASRAKAEAEARRRAEEEARAKAEAAARRAEEEEEAAAQARARAAAAASAQEEEEDDFEDFELSSSTTVVAANTSSSSAAATRPAVVEEEEEDLGILADSSRSSSSRSSSSASPSRSSASSRTEDLDEELDEEPRSSSSRTSGSTSRSSSSSSRYDDLDEEPRSSSSRSSSSASRSSSSREDSAKVERDEDEGNDASVLLAGRLGFAPYQGLGFVTYGAEVGYLVSGGLAIAGGVEAYSVQRTIPPENLEPGESAKQWNTILPLNIGLQYHIGQSKVRPYLGAEMLVVPGIVRGSSTPALGGRGRVGANFFVADAVALNLNGAVGFLSGKDMQTIADDMDKGAIAPQVSGGTVLFF